MEQTLHNAFKRFSLGDELRAYTFLGCHAAERDGVHGYVFRVWAPRAQGVSVTGDWNFWNTEDLPMTLVEYGIWEAFSAYAREGDAYKFYIRRRDGGFLYQAMAARFGNAAPVTPGQEYVSAALLRSGDPLLPDYFDRLIPSLERTVEGLRRGSEPERLHYYETALRELREMRELYDNGC